MKSTHLARHEAHPRHIRALGKQDRTHGIGLRIEVPLLVRPRNEATLGIPGSDPGEAVVETEEHQPLGGGAFVGSNGEPAAAVLHVVFEDEAVEDAAVDEGDGDLLVVVVIVAGDEVPSASRDVLVDAGDGRLPVFFPVEGAIDALAAVEPVGGAEGSAQAEEEVGSHF